MVGPPKRGGFKKASFTAPKRSAPGASTQPAKRAKQDSGDEEEGDEGPVVPVLRTDDEGVAYVAINHSAKRRVTISAFKNSTLVSIREYYDADGVMKPGKKGISLTVDQYNALLSAAPLLERELAKSGEKVVRPVYDGAESGDVSGEADEKPESEDGEEQKVEDEDEDEEDEE